MICAKLRVAHNVQLTKIYLNLNQCRFIQCHCHLFKMLLYMLCNSENILGDTFEITFTLMEKVFLAPKH